MDFIPVPDTALVEVVCGLDDQIVENTLYFNHTGAWSATELTDLANVILDWWDTNMKPLVTSAVTLLQIKATDLTTDVGASITLVPTTAIAGTASGAPGPNNSAFVLKFNTAGRGRSSRGRNYVFGFNEADVSISRISSVLADQFKNAYVQLLVAAGDFGAPWVVVSRFHNKLPRTEGIAQPIISVNYTDLVVDSQRRRLPGRGT